MVNAEDGNTSTMDWQRTLPWPSRSIGTGWIGVSPEPVILAVLFGANMSFASPYGDQTNLWRRSAGGYKFADFLRVGIPLTIIMWVGFSIALPMLYQL